MEGFAGTGVGWGGSILKLTKAELDRYMAYAFFSS